MVSKAKEEPISEFYSDSGDRKATISRDRYHIVARLFDVVQGGLLREYETRLYTDVSIRDIEDVCESFVSREGVYK